LQQHVLVSNGPARCKHAAAEASRTINSFAPHREMLALRRVPGDEWTELATGAASNSHAVEFRRSLEGSLNVSLIV